MPTSVEPSHPPPYGTDQSPAYELQERPVVSRNPDSASTSRTFDDATVESCAPKRPPRKFVWTREIKIWLAIGLIALVGLISGMIAFGVMKKREKDQTWPPNLELATSTVDPWVPSSPIPADGTLLSPFNFSSPSASYFPPSSRYQNSNYNILSSWSQTFSIRSNPILSIKIFGSHSSQVTIFEGTNSSSATLINVKAFWRVPDAWNDTSSKVWGVDALSKTTGGLFGDGEGTGVILNTSADAIYQPTLWSSGLASDGNNTLVFNITVTIPPSSSIANLSIFAEPDTTVMFWNLSTVTFDVIDVRTPRGFVDSEVGTTAHDIQILAKHIILGTWNTYRSLLFICHGTIQSRFSFLSSPTPSNTQLPFSAKLITKDLPGHSEGSLLANVTSLPPNSNLTFNAVALNSSVQVHFPRNAFAGSWNVATAPSKGSAGAMVAAEESASGGVQYWNPKRRTSRKGTTTVNGTKGGSSTCQINAGGDYTVLVGVN